VLEGCEERTVPTVLGVVWTDGNASGTPDAGEGVAGLAVTLTPPDGPAVTATTDANGVYALPDTASGAYAITVSTATGAVLGSVTSTAGSDAPPVLAVALNNAMNLLSIRPRAEIEADIAAARLALEKAEIEVTVAKAVQVALGVQVTKADERVTALTKEFGDTPTDAQKAQIAEAKAAADRIYKDYEASGGNVVRAIRNRDGIYAMLQELVKERDRKFD
jgi:cytoskeletal protein RodZ